jgi:5'-deoxynucleotidase YfbR-like HD superfamily hydrolase
MGTTEGGLTVLMVMETPRIVRTEDTFIRTYTGAKFWPLDPRADEVSIEDIAHALSLVCRFTGHTYCFYSVAEHSLRVSKLAEQLILKQNKSRNAVVITSAREVALWGLLHDASEAYLCDVPSPIKRAPGLGQLYKGFERNLMEVIAERFDLMPHEPAVVKDADRILLKTEMRDLMDAKKGFSLDWDYADYLPLPETIFPIDPQQAEVEFMSRFEALTMALKAERAVNGE